MFSTTTPGIDAIRYTSGEGDLDEFDAGINLIEDDTDLLDNEDASDDYDRYEDEYGYLSDEWLDDHYEDSLRAKFSRNARNGGDW